MSSLASKKTETPSGIPGILLSVGATLCAFMALTIMLSELGLVVGLAISGITGLLGFALAIVLIGSVLQPHWKELLIIAMASIVIITICDFISSLFFDFSYDGNGYHKAAIGSLREGWNPFASSINDFPGYTQLFLTATPWPDHYAQGLWRLSACIYDLTGNIEAAKSPTLIAAISSALVGAAYTRVGQSPEKKLHTWQSLILFLVIALNPIVAAQFATFYCDAYLMMELFSLIIGLVFLSCDNSTYMRRLAYILIACAFTNCVSTKFTGILYASAFGFSFFVLYVWKAHAKQNGFTPKRIGRIFLFFILIFVVSVVAVNYTPYVTNTLNHGNPFYPLMGDGTIDIMTAHTPIGYDSMPPAGRLLASVLSEVGNGSIANGQSSALKIPFVIHKEELAYLAIPDARTSGFGIIYGGIFIISLGLYIPMTIVSMKRLRALFQIELAYLIPTILLLVCLGESWWARYSGYMYFGNILLLVFLFFWTENVTKSPQKQIVRIVSAGFAALLLCNAGLTLGANTLANSIRTATLKTTLHEIIDISRSEEAVLLYAKSMDSENRYGYLYALRDQGLDFEVSPPPENVDIIAEAPFRNFILYITRK